MSDYTQTTDFSIRTGTDANAGALLDAELAAIATAIATKYDSSSTVAVAAGGTGANDAAAARTNLGLDELATQNTVLGAFIRAEDGASGSSLPVTLAEMTLTAGDRVIIFATGEFTCSAGSDGWWKIEKSAGTATVTFDHNNSDHRIGAMYGSAGTVAFAAATIANVTVSGTATFRLALGVVGNKSADVDYQIYAIAIRGA